MRYRGTSTRPSELRSKKKLRMARLLYDPTVTNVTEINRELVNPGGMHATAWTPPTGMTAGHNAFLSLALSLRPEN
jgi:hypothetical protein